MPPRRKRSRVSSAANSAGPSQHTPTRQTRSQARAMDRLTNNSSTAANRTSSTFSANNMTGHQQNNNQPTASQRRVAPSTITSPAAANANFPGSSSSSSVNNSSHVNSGSGLNGQMSTASRPGVSVASTSSDMPSSWNGVSGAVGGEVPINVPPSSMGQASPLIPMPVNNMLSGNGEIPLLNNSCSQLNFDVGQSFNDMGNVLQNSSMSALTSVCAPLGISVPQKLREKILKGEYIELGQLLHSDFSNGGKFTLNVNDEGKLMWEDAKVKSRITSIQSWTDAFLIFSAVYLEGQPKRAQELLKYMSIVRTAAQRYQGYGWREYDKLFRMRHQLQPLRSWATIDSELWSLYAAVGTPWQHSPGNFWGNSGQSSFRRPMHPNFQRFKQSGSKANSRGPLDKICFSYNAAGCSRANCRFKHTCAKCKSGGHGARDCKASK